jgi:serine/threonine protein kinase
LTARLSHWNAVEVYDCGRTADGTFFYVMEYLPGLSLEDVLARHGPLPAGRVVHLLRQICHALREAHVAGLIHRDVKPGNVFVARRGGLYDVVKLLDFGLVKPVAELASARLTQKGVITGTPQYMSPEQARGRSDVDARSDIYSLGAVAYALLTGRAPFERSTPFELPAW